MNDRGVELAEVVDAGGGHDAGEFGGLRLDPVRDADYDLTIRNTGRGGKVFIPYQPGKQVLTVEV